MLVAFSVAPSGGPDGTDSVHDAVAAAVKIVRESGLPNHTDAMFTTIEGEWDEVFDVVKRATEAVQAFGPRVSLALKADIRPGYTGQLTAKVERIEQALGESARAIAAQAERRVIAARLAELTDRERRVAQLVIEGLPNKLIADQLSISVRTVEVHRARVFEKMEVKSAVELANLLRGMPRAA